MLKEFPAFKANSISHVHIGFIETVIKEAAYHSDISDTTVYIFIDNFKFKSTIAETFFEMAVARLF